MAPLIQIAGESLDAGFIGTSPWSSSKTGAHSQAPTSAGAAAVKNR
jgi:hypothetical protein